VVPHRYAQRIINHSREKNMKLRPSPTYDPLGPWLLLVAVLTFLVAVLTLLVTAGLLL
jgi:hypothetical protein